VYELKTQMELIRSKRETARREGEGARARANAEELTTRQRSEALEKIRLEISAKDAEEQRESDLYWVAHFLAKAKGETPLDFDKWLETIEDVNFDANAKNGLTVTESSTK
jgi:hypothetical protein